MAYHKVEISGMNTADLKVLTEKERRALLLRIQKGDRKAREEMILGNLKLVLSVVGRFASRGECSDDLFQVGVIGLLKAIDNFDLSLNVKFSTYGVALIAGELRRHMRDTHHLLRVSRSLRDLAYQAMRAREKLTADLQREPTVQEIAGALHEPEHEVVIALEALSDPVSLDEPVFTDGGDPLYLLDQVGDPETSSDWLDLLAMRETAKALPDREREILRLRFLLGKTQMEVAGEIGISQAQVSRLEKHAIAAIRENWQA